MQRYWRKLIWKTTQKFRSKYSFPDVIEEITCIKEKIQDKNTVEETMKIVITRTPSQLERTTRRNEEIVGFEDLIENLRNQLLNGTKGKDVISIHDMPGLVYSYRDLLFALLCDAIGECSELRELHANKLADVLRKTLLPRRKEMNDLAEVYPELNVLGSAPNDVYSQVIEPDTHGIVRTLGKGAAPSFVYGPVYKRSQNEQREFDKRVEVEVQKVDSTMRIEMEEKLSEAKEEIEVMDKKLSKTEEDMEMMKKNISEANMNMEVKIDDKVKAWIQAYIDSLGITLGSNKKSFGDEQIPNNSIEDRQ